jgi:hypothetical protein
VRRRLTPLAACLALAAFPLAGCGKKEPGIPRSDASELIKLLQTAREQADDPQKCNDLLATIRDIRAKVRDLPSKTDSDVRDSLSNGVRNLAASASSQCSQENTNTNTTPTETTPTETTPTQTTPPPTTPPPTTPPPTTPPPTQTTPTPPVPTTPGTGGTPGNGNGNGNGKGNGKKKKLEGAGGGHGHGHGHGKDKHR